MGILIGWAAKLVGEKLAGPMVWAIMLALVVGGLWWLRADAHADGRALEKAAWEEAIDEAEKQAAAVAVDVEEERDDRAVDWAEQVREEKEQVDDAIEAGRDPFDVMFGTSGVRGRP